MHIVDLKEVREKAEAALPGRCEYGLNKGSCCCKECVADGEFRRSLKADDILALLNEIERLKDMCLKHKRKAIGFHDMAVRLAEQRDRLRKHLADAVQTLEGLAEQQAMPDPWWEPIRDRLAAALEENDG